MASVNTSTTGTSQTGKGKGVVLNPRSAAGRAYQFRLETRTPKGRGGRFTASQLSSFRAQALKEAKRK